MTDKTKRIILIAAGVLLCAVLVVGIVSRLAAVPMPIDPAIPDDTPNTKDPVVNISDPEVKVDSKTDGKQHDPGRDADNSGTEQTIQGTPTKPDAVDVTKDELARICSAVSIPVVGIGGLHAGTLDVLADTGVDGAAVVSAIFAADDIPAATRALAAEIDRIL